ncbi:hypothetical protein [Sphingopyxis sp. YR583]|uniref:hypothetical protein n=1 Tax=Sphingopyxis sp. YR583 TaxID=1881047 RepID=UPI000B87AC32|nr:hypothetical protein [Sphingopyxis sp. YR583]
MQELQPHGAQWFAVVLRTAPAFAQAVRFTIQCERSSRVCSICGEPPVGDFRVIEPVVTPRGVPTIRLCDCCLTASDNMGEMLVPVRGPDSVTRRIARAGQATFGALWKRIYLARR